MNVDRSIMIHLCSSRRTVFISVCFFFSLSHLCLWTWPWEKPFEFYRNAYRQASSLFNTLLGFAFGIHVAQRFISLKKRNRTLRLSALGHRRWGNGNQSLSHFPAVRVPSGATQTTITASLPHHVVKPFSALVFFFFHFDVSRSDADCVFSFMRKQRESESWEWLKSEQPQLCREPSCGLWLSAEPPPSSGSCWAHIQMWAPNLFNDWLEKNRHGFKIKLANRTGGNLQPAPEFESWRH